MNICSASEDNKNNNNCKESKASKDRSITNMRNKDRPSLQIYQPGKRRTNSTSGSTPTDEKGEDKCMDATENFDYEIEEAAASTDKAQSSSKNDEKKRNDAKESSKIDDRKKPSNEKRISRYSEKRNKAKEKRDLTDNPVMVSDCNQEKNDELS